MLKHSVVESLTHSIPKIITFCLFLPNIPTYYENIIPFLFSSTTLCLIFHHYDSNKIQVSLSVKDKIVISTITYKQLDGINYFKVDSNCDGFKRQVLEICNKPNEVLKQYANQGSLVKKMFSTEVWNKTMTDIENYSK